MGRKLIIPGADFSQNGMPDLYTFDYFVGGFNASGAYNTNTNRARTNKDLNTMPSFVITNTTSVVINDTYNLRWAYCVRNADNTPYDVTGLSVWRSTSELPSSELSAFIGKYLVVVARFVDNRVISNDDITYIKSKIFYSK